MPWGHLWGPLGHPGMKKGAGCPRIPRETPPLEPPRAAQNRPEITKINQNNDMIFMQFFKTSFFNTLPAKRYPKASQIRPKSMKIETKTRNRDFIKMCLFPRRQHDFEGSDDPEAIPKSKKMLPKAMLAFNPQFFTNLHQI